MDALRGIGVLTAKLEVEETIPQERTYDFPKVPRVGIVEPEIVVRHAPFRHAS